MNAKKVLKNIINLTLGVFFMVSLLVSTSTFAQTTDAISANQLDQKANIIKIKQDSQSNLNNSISVLEKENGILEKEILDLKKANTEIEGKATKLLTDNDVISNNLTKISQDEAKIYANKQTIQETKNKLATTQNELQNEVSSFQTLIVGFSLSISKFIGFIVGYWLFYWVLRWLINRLIPSETVKNILQLVLTFGTIFVSFITIFIAFAGNTTYLGPTLGVFSAALIVALQDFIASFFSWVVIKARGPYKLGDAIEIPTPVNGGTLTGVVTQIGFFRTRIREKLGGDSPDREQFTGKTIFFPNNLILKQGFRNFTFDNKILWHTIKFTVTFESDFDVAKDSIEDVIHKEFHYMLDHKDVYLDDVYNLKTVYKPKVYLHVGDTGPVFTVWLPCKVGNYRDLLEKVSIKILKEFKKNQIELAYPTSRIVRRGDLDRSYTSLDDALGTPSI
jgi:small-conductance mechanosensitive channel